MSNGRENAVRRKLGDRRNRPRYDIVGDLWGTLETVLRLSLRNIGSGGALLESHMPLPGESIQRVTFSWNGQDTTTQVRVRHVERRILEDGEPTYLIGVEFLAVHPVLATEIDRLLLNSRDHAATPAEA